MEILIQAGQFILSLSLLIVLHELGHMLPAKYFKTRVEKFYLFFNPWFSLFKIKRGETEYGLGWLPLGGYVKIAGMIDESMDKEQMKQEPQPWEFRSKPAWQRLIIMVGGVVVNLFLGFFIYSMVLFAYGETVLPNKSLKDGVWVVSDLAEDLGFQNGDKIVEVNGVEPELFQDVTEELLYSGGAKVKLERDGQPVELAIPEDFAGQLSESRERLFFPRVPFVIKQVPDTSINAKSGLEPKDKILSIDGVTISYFDEAKDMFSASKGKTVTAVVLRENEEKTVQLLVSDAGKIGVQNMVPNYKDMAKMELYDFDTQTYSFIASFGAGWTKAGDRLQFYLRQFKLIFNPSSGAIKGMGGFAAIGGMFPPTWEWQVFWETTAFLSLILAFMNILPIPALDGGHVMFLMYEMITSREPNPKILEKAQMVGMVLLLSLILFANGNDIYRIFFK